MFTEVLTDEILARDYGWTETGRRIFRERYLRKAGVPERVAQRNGHSDLYGFVPASGTAFSAEVHIDQALQRLAGFWAHAGLTNGYFDEGAAEAFRTTILDDLRHRRAFPNSPQFFNSGLYWAYGIEPAADPAWGIDGKPARVWDAQVHACFIQSVEDNLVGERGISDLLMRQSRVFKGGSGTGTNFSALRERGAGLSGGGSSSGMLSFLGAFDANAGTVKSGGVNRRSASMVVIDHDHPDVIEAANLKARGEDEALAMAVGAAVLHEQGLAPYLPPITLGWNGDESAYAYARGQNANNTIRANGAELWGAYDRGESVDLVSRVDGSVTKIAARDLVHTIAEAAWYSADPGVQWSDLINAWHTSPSRGEIRASNPCVTGDTLIMTSEGWRRIDSLCDAPFEVMGGDGQFYPVKPAFKTGNKQVCVITLENGVRLRCTLDHLITCADGIDRPAESLQVGDQVRYWRDICGGSFTTRRVLSILVTRGFEDVYDLTEPNTSHFVANGFVVHNCSEYLFVDDTACNLASIRLSAFLFERRASDWQKCVDWQGLADCARRWARVLDISISAARYPTKRIADLTRDTRTIGLGPMDLGGALIRLGLHYDSQAGRDCAAALQATIHGAAGYESQQLAEALEPCAVWHENRTRFEAVWNKHREATYALNPYGFVPVYWPMAAGAFRNAQWTVIAPTGTIGLASGCCTTGCEPLYQAEVVKSLAGGGSITLKAACVEDCPDPRAIVTAAELSWDGHLRMVAALQPFVSGGISKTLNLPHDTTAEAIARIYRRAWELGVKCVSVYRNGSKHSQVLGGGDPDTKVRAILEAAKKPRRDQVAGRLDAERLTARIANEACYLTVAWDKEGRPLQLRLEHGSAGGRDAVAAEALSKVCSVALQYGVPLEVLAETLIDVQGGPAGPVVGGSGNVKFAGSVYAWAGREILAGAEGAAPASDVSGGVSDTADRACPQCGGSVQRTGTCETCVECGYSLGGCA